MNRTLCIDRMRIDGFRSLQSIDVSLRRVTLLIGPNGSGKSNFLRFLELMSSIASGCLSEFVSREGGADAQLYGGSKRTSRIFAIASSETKDTLREYEFSLSHAFPDDLVLSGEVFRECDAESMTVRESSLGLFDSLPIDPRFENRRHSMIIEQRTPINGDFLNLIRGVVQFRFHEILNGPKFKTAWDAEDYHMLRQDAANIAAVLLHLKRNNTRRYDFISHLFSRVVPTFDRFYIEENLGKVVLKWKPKGINNTIGLHHTSSGSIRFLALATLVNLPKKMLPIVLLIDQPELGIHPASTALMCAMIEIISHDCQVIIATQSPKILDHFGLESTIVFDVQPDGKTCAKTLSEKDYRYWLDKDYSPSDLWSGNDLGGRP